jgi:peptidoglycan/LPS O-acetylase OafA/YrhL
VEDLMHARFRELDGLRGVAVLMVLAFHCTTVPTVMPSIWGMAQRLTWAGWAGVDVFFVLSGFLVGGILIDSRGQDNVLQRFMIRRAMRIIPLYIIILLSAWILPALTGIGYNSWPFGESLPWWSYASLTQNFVRPILNTDSGYLGHTWSLALELQIYVIAGILLIYAPKRLIPPIIIAGIVIAWSTRATASYLGAGMYGYFILPARLDAACIGILSAIVVRNDVKVGWIKENSNKLWLLSGILFGAALALVGIGHGIGSWGSSIYNHLGFATGTALVIILCTTNCGKSPGKILALRPLVSLGAVSYAVYLFHYPVISLTNIYFGNNSMMIDSTAGKIGTIVGILLTFALAALSWRFIEAPLIKLSHSWTRSSYVPDNSQQSASEREAA